MRKAEFYRYLLGIRPDADLCRLLRAVVEKASQRVRMEMLHLTLCVIAETCERDPFLLPRVQSALVGHSLSSFPVRLGRVCGGSDGAVVKASGSQHDIQDFYRALVSLAAARDIAPLHRKSGLHAHVTLGHDPCRFEPFRAPIEWFPGEMLLIESEVGLGRHNVIARWPLLPSAQGSLPFDPPMSWRAAA